MGTTSARCVMISGCLLISHALSSLALVCGSYGWNITSWNIQQLHGKTVQTCCLITEISIAWDKILLSNSLANSRLLFSFIAEAEYLEIQFLSHILHVMCSFTLFSACFGWYVKPRPTLYLRLRYFLSIHLVILCTSWARALCMN